MICCIYQYVIFINYISYVIYYWFVEWDTTILKKKKRERAYTIPHMDNS